jgi:hypothetical protein
MKNSLGGVIYVGKAKVLKIECANIFKIQEITLPR